MVMKNVIMQKIRAFIFIFLMYIIYWLLYFIPAGIIPAGGFPGYIFEMPIPWIYFILQAINAAVLFACMDPDLIKERMELKPDAKKWDILFNRVYAVSGFLLIITAGCDVGLIHLTPLLPLWVKISLIAILLAGAVFTDWAVLSNKFFSRFVRIQKDRGHYVNRKGPYQFIRHPAYLFSLVMIVALPILLNSFLAYIPALVCSVLMVWRTYKEDQTLKQELEGYLDYTKEVKYRLIPGLF
jgi:protein-S-isoprenylcysteine O-methyltransferase Ste14